MRRWLLVIVLALPAVLRAQEPAPAEPPADAAGKIPPLWEMRLAVFGRYGPSYRGSENNQFNLIPLPLPVYRGRFFRLGEDSENPIRGRIFRTDRVKLDFDFDLNFPVRSEDVDARTGMPDLDFLLEVGPELELQFTREPKFGGNWFLALQARPAFSFDGLDPTYRGVSFSTEFKYKVKFAEGRDALLTRITPTWGTSKYAGFFYDVQPEFATPERAEYESSGGYLGTDLTFSWINTINKDWEFVVGTRLSFNQGAKNRDSDLFTKDTGVAVYAAFTWKFWESERRAAFPGCDADCL